MTQLGVRLIDALTEYRETVIRTGHDTPVERIVVRMLFSAFGANSQGLVDLTLYMTGEDMTWYAEAIGCVPRAGMILVDDIPIGFKAEEPPFSVLVGFDAEGRITPYPVMTNDEWVSSGRINLHD